MSKTVLIILSTVLVLGLTLLVTNILSRRKKTDLADWEVGGRDLPYYVVIGTQFATAMGGGVLVGHVGNAYNFGLSILFYGVFSSSTLLFIALIAKWLRRNNFVTVPDVVQSFRGRNKAISIFAGVMSAVIPFGWCISNLSAFAKLYTRMTGIPMNVLITCLAIACIAFVLPAGLKTVAWTDFIFGIVIVIGGVFVTMKSLDMAGGFSNVVEVLPPEIMSFPKGLFAVGGFTLLSWFLSLVPGGITNQMYFQRVFAIRDEKRIVPTLLISVVLVFLTDVWAFFMGTSIRAQNPDLAGEMATGWLLDQLPIWFKARRCTITGRDSAAQRGRDACGTATRISTSLSRRLSALFAETPLFRPVSRCVRSCWRRRVCTRFHPKKRTWAVCAGGVEGRATNVLETLV